MVIATSASRTASAGESATRGTALSNPTSFLRLRFHTTSWWPARATLAAIGMPMAPRPRNATRIDDLLLSWRRSETAPRAARCAAQPANGPQHGGTSSAGGGHFHIARSNYEHAANDGAPM